MEYEAYGGAFVFGVKLNSLLNSNFKVITGLESGRFRKVFSHTLCEQQLADADDRRISFGVCLARDALYAVELLTMVFRLHLTSSVLTG